MKDVPHLVEALVDKVASGLKRMSSKADGGTAYAFQRCARAEGTAADCLTVAAALLLLPTDADSPSLLPEGLRPLVQRAAELIGPGAAAGQAAAGLAAVQHQVHDYVARRLAQQPRPQDASALLAALCTEAARGSDDSDGSDGAVLPPYRLALRPVRSCAACGWRDEGSEQQLHCVELTGADVSATDSVLHASPSLFDLQKALWGCAALRGGACSGTAGSAGGSGSAAGPPCPSSSCSGGALEARLEVVALPKWLFVVLRRREPQHHFALPSAVGEARVGPDLDGCAAIQLRGPNRQLAGFELRAVFSTDRDRHSLVFMRCPPGAACAADCWLSYGIYADGRLSPAGGAGERRPNILDGHFDEDPSNIWCLLFEQRSAPPVPSARVPAAAHEAATAGTAAPSSSPAAPTEAALAAAAVAGFVAGLDARRLQRCAEGAALGPLGVPAGRGRMETQVAQHLLPDVHAVLRQLSGSPLEELRERCAAHGLEQEGAAEQLRLRLAIRKLQERFDLV